MTVLFYYLLKVILCSGILFLYYHLALRNKLFHQWNRFYLLLATVLSFLLPVVQFELFFFPDETGNSTAFLYSLQSANQTLEALIVTGNQTHTLYELVFTTYLTISIVFFLLFIYSLIRIVLLIRSHNVHRFRNINFIQTATPGTPFSFFDYIFWNPSLPLDTVSGEQIFQHELVHVQEKHSYDKILIKLVLAVFWCNPIFWLIKKELHCIHEFIADRKAVGDKNASGLAALILQSVYPAHYPSLTNQFFHTSIKRRIAMLTKKENRVVNYIARLVALPLVAFTVFAFTVRTKSAESDNKSNPVFTSLQSLAVSTDTIPKKEKEIYSVDVNKAAEKVTITYKDGSKEVLSKADLKKRTGLQPEGSLPSKDLAQKPLYFVDDKEFTGDVNTLDPQSIQSVNVLKGKHAIDKYGKKGENGVVEITLKKGAKNVATLATEPIFNQTETPASIDQQEWRAFLEKHLQPIIVNAAGKGAKPGNYTVQVQFLVKKDGSVSDFKALNNPGYEFDKQILAVMPNSPNWKPAMQNGKIVTSYHTQPITFVIAEQ